MGVRHEVPPHPAAHRQRPGERHVPRAASPEHACSQTGEAQPAPDQPASHAHTSGSAHRPCPPQSPQRTTSHALPLNPSWQAHLPVSPSHSPRPEQFRGQRPVLQSAPPQPGGQ